MFHNSCGTSRKLKENKVAIQKITNIMDVNSISHTQKVLSLGRTKLYQLINDGKLKARKIGKRTVILREDLETFLASLQPYSESEARND